MSRLPAISSEELIKILSKPFDFYPVRQRGSHVVLQKDRIVFSVPLHKTLKKGTLKAILKQAGISAEELADKL